MPQLESLAEVGLAGLGRQTDRERELGHAELRDQRGTGSGDRERLVPVAGEQRRLVDRLRRVQVRPGHRGLEQVGLGSVCNPTARSRASSRTPQQWSCGVEVGCHRAHAPILLEQVFDSRVDLVDISRDK